MENKRCLGCYHWQGYGFCAIVDVPSEDCKDFLDYAGIRSYFEDDPAGRTSAVNGGEGRPAGPVKDKKD